MDEARVERRLAAIFAGDIAGYSRLMGMDEEGTLHQLKAHRKELVDPKITEHRGRIVKTTGDGMLVEFVSVVDAVRCAVDIQRGMAERNVDVAADKRIEFRVGINVGDIISDTDDIYGDGVNVAARLEALADPGGIMVSRNVFDQVRDKLSFGFEDMGEQTVKNIARPIGVHRVSLVENAAPIVVYGVVAEKPSARVPLALPDKPSIAVLPFNNMSGDPDQEYFADGMAEEILTALSHCKSLFVIARNSSFTYKGKSVDVRQVGRELGVRYVLEGSVRRSGDRLRFTAQLVDATSGAHIWADRFDGGISDVFDLQDRIAESVVAVIEPNVQLAEIERMKHKPVANLDAYDLLLRAQQLEYEFTAESFDAALRCSEQALIIDPNYAQAMALAAYCYAERSQQGWLNDRALETSEGIRLAARAVELAKSDSNVLWMAAYAARQLSMDAQLAKELAYRSLQLNPNSAIAQAMAGWIEAILANPIKALELLHRADRLSPRDPRSWFIATGIGLAHFIAGQFDDSIVWTKKALAQNP
ncbi:MAG: adenylate/guanylate cyclase domain-containing protein, partial [Deltaproteobacteria bacterium]|nr:adenylate/guanylate cyclase domain-containing protein [Deltaproteobacteria bacterium]